MTNAEDWTAALPIDDLPDGKPVRANVEGVSVLVYRTGEDVFAVSNRCTHQGAPLDKGVVRPGHDPAVTCPAHGSVFRLADGLVLRGPATITLEAYETRVTEGTLEIRPSGGSTPTTSDIPRPDLDSRQ